MHIHEASIRKTWSKQIMFISAAFETFIHANKSTRFKNMKSIIICMSSYVPFVTDIHPENTKQRAADEVKSLRL